MNYRLQGQCRSQARRYTNTHTDAKVCKTCDDYPKNAHGETCCADKQTHHSDNLSQIKICP